MVKRYITIKNTKILNLPSWFYDFQGRKWISIVSFTFINYDNSDIISYEDIELHADFVKKDDTLNGYLCNSGNTIHKRPKWEIFDDQRMITFDLTPMNGSTMTFDESTHKFIDGTFDNSYFIIQMLLETEK